MARSSSSGQEFHSARTSPERSQSPDSSSSGYQEVPEYQQDAIFEPAPSIKIHAATSHNSLLELDPSEIESLQASQPTTNHPSLQPDTTVPQTFLSAATPSCSHQAERHLLTVPIDSVRIMQTIPEEEDATPTIPTTSGSSSISQPSVAVSSATNLWPAETNHSPSKTNFPPISASNPSPIIQPDLPDPRPPHLAKFFTGYPSNPPPTIPTPASHRTPYDNGVPDIPTHWIPLYGSAHSIFYDPITKLFHNDGPPRPTLERPDGTMPATDTTPHLPLFNHHREDVLHIQPRAITDPLVHQASSAANPVMGHRHIYYYCKCQRSWLSRRHYCPDDRVSSGMVVVGGGVPMMMMMGARMAAVRPGDRMAEDGFTRELVVGDLGYLTAGQRHAYETGLPMPMVRSSMAVPVVSSRGIREMS
ncbi:MAG: hypothetical protein Q9186_003495 [Xanthomendoza sp. 1 TL-2023]